MSGIARQRGAGLLAVALATLGFSLRASEGGNSSADVKELLDRMRAMEQQMARQAAEIGALKGQLRTAQQVAEIRPTLNQRVDAALDKGTSDRFFHDPELHPRKIQIGGHVDVTYQFNMNRPEKIDPDAVASDPLAGTLDTPSAIMPRNVFRIFDRDESNDFTANQVELFFDGRAQDPGQAGFYISLDFGEDPVTAAGITGEQIYTFNNIKEGYIDYIAPVGNGINFRFGRFVTDHGFEVIESHNNWNATRSFNFGLAIPFTHTGVKVHYDVFENWQLCAMVTNGWDNTLDNNDDKYFHLRSTWKPVDWITWVLNGSMGNEGGQTGRDESAMRYLVNTNVYLHPWEKWEFGLEGNYGVEKDEDQKRFRTGSGSYNDAIWWGAAGYAKWSFLDKWYAAVRGEYFKDRGGTRTGLTNDSGFGNRVELYSLTATVNWNLADNMNIRFEYRHDGASHNAFIDMDRHPGFDNPGTEAGLNPGNPSRDGRATQDTVMVQFLYNF
ncbi:MAG: porin [Planctomycetota bacterium]|nr:porin [Planctomycetota bacterium]